MDPANTSWKDLVVDFTRNTTCHGIRYLTLPSWYWYIRKFIWIIILLCAFTAFLYLASIKLDLYFRYEKIVNVEVQFRQEMKFPAVTFCNLNFFRMTALHQYGLIDALSVFNSDSYLKGKEILPVLQSSGSKYYYDSHICDLPSEVVWKQTYNSITRQMCATLCSSQHNSNCTSFLYNQKDQSCTLSSYSTEWVDDHGTEACKLDGPMEYYLRRRSYDKSLNQIICTFEKGTVCPFMVEITEDSRMDEWSVISAAGRLPNEDLTMESGDGHYLLFAETARKPGYKARYVSPFLNTTEKCLNLFYRFLGNRTSLSVYVRTTDLKEYHVASVSWFQPTIKGEISKEFAGTQLHEVLPAGEYQVIIEAQRSKSSVVTSGAVIDNLIIANCKQLDDKNCMRSRSGYDYTGTISKTVSGKKCLAWNTIRLDDDSLYTMDMFPDSSLEAVKNYCRNPGGSGMMVPFCHYLTPQGIIAMERCNISYCSCIGTNVFHCTSGLCVSNQLLCDGVDHCGDNSDEQLMCGKFEHVNCHFEDPFLCGYKPDTDFIAQWKWHRNDMEGINGDPLTDSRGSSIGHYLLIDNRGITVGDQAFINTPTFEADGMVSLQFYTFIRMKPTDIFSTLSVFLLNSQGRSLQEIYSVNHQSLTKQGRWNTIKLCLALPANNYSIQFMGIVGEAYQTILAFDGVDLTPKSTDCTGSADIISLNQDETVSSSWTGCSFEPGSTCNMSQNSWNYWAAWRMMPLGAIDNVILNYAESATPSVLSTKASPYCKQGQGDAVEETISNNWNCTLRTYDLEGDISSPDFPSNYHNNLDMTYTILLSDVTEINLQSTFMDIEQTNSWCKTDYIMVTQFINGSAVDNQGKKRICGKDPFSQQVIADEVAVHFHSDSARSKKGFNIKFKAEPSPSTEYILALSNRGLQTSGATVPYIVHLDFPLVTDTDKIYCLSFLSMLAIKLEVKLVADIHEEVLLRVQRMLFWQQYSVSIPRQLGPYFVRFTSNVVYYGSVEISYFAFLSNVSMDFGSCAVGKADTLKPGYCDFEHGLCGYTEESESFSTWRIAAGKEVSSSLFFPMEYNDAKQGLKILFVFFESGTDVAILKSPKINANNEQCLSIDYLCRPQHDQSNFILILLHKTGEKNKMVFNKIDKPCKCSDSGKCAWKSINATLPRGSYEVQIEASAQAKSGSWAYFAIDNINFAKGACQNPMISYKDTESEAKPLYNATVLSFDNGTGLQYEKFNVNFKNRIKDQGNDQIILGNISVMIKSMQDTTVFDIIEKTAHTAEDIILNCKWNYEDCSAKDFHAVDTEFGICYTFNAQKESQRTTNETGSGSGLQLLLNIEQYEHLTGAVSQPGVKVFLHDPDEIPYVKYVGVAVPPGMHSFLNVQHEESNRLTLPYGKCTSDSDPYYPDEIYTRYRCERRCQTQNLQRVCGCRNSFMPGKAKLCTLEEFLSCAFPKSYVTGDIKAENCTCFEACNTSHYYGVLSYTRLSELNVDLYLKNKRAEIENKFQAATRLRNRLDKSELDCVLKPLNNIRKYHNEFMQTLKFHVVDRDTSTIEIIKEVARIFQDEAIYELKTVLFPNITLMTKEYETKMSSFWRSILDPLEEFIRYSHNYRSVLTYIVKEHNLPKSHKWIRHVEKSFSNLLPYVVSVLDLYIYHHSLSFNNNLLPMKYSLDESACSQKLQEDILPIFANITVLVQNLNITQMNSGANTTSYETTGLNDTKLSFKENNENPQKLRDIENIRNYMEIIEKWYIDEMKPICVLEYSKFLEDLNIYLESIETLPVQNRLENNFDKGDELVKLIGDNAKIERISRAYLKGYIDKVQLSHLFDRENVTLLKTNMENVFTAINTGIFDNLDTYLEDLSIVLFKWYSKALGYGISIGDYMSEDENDLEQQFRTIKLWRKPLPDLKSPQLIAYAYPEDDIGNSWPKGQDMTQFFNQDIADFVIQTRLEGFFTSLSSEITSLRVNLNNLMENFIVALNMLSQELHDFEERTAIDGNFVMDNFAEVNIFYGELKYNDIEELPAYDIPTFFSDMGGFMGLFVGMSCITICEVLDLIIYNSVVKLTITGTKKIRRTISKRTSAANITAASNNESTFMTSFGFDNKEKPHTFEECL